MSYSKVTRQAERILTTLYTCNSFHVAPAAVTAMRHLHHRAVIQILLTGTCRLRGSSSAVVHILADS